MLHSPPSLGSGAAFANKTCQVEWNGSGWVHDTAFREAAVARKRRPVTRIEAEAARPTKLPKKRPRTPARAPEPASSGGAAKEPPARRRSSKSIEGGSSTYLVTADCVYDGLGLQPTAKHYITTELRKTRREVMSTLPDSVTSMLGSCVWVRWDTEKRWRGMYLPALVISPFDVGGETREGILHEWLTTYLDCRARGCPERMHHLVYWYQHGWSDSKNFKAFSTVEGGKIYSFEHGIARNWHRQFAEKIDNPQIHDTLTEDEDNVFRGINQMMVDQGLVRGLRGG